MRIILRIFVWDSDSLMVGTGSLNNQTNKQTNKQTNNQTTKQDSFPPWRWFFRYIHHVGNDFFHVGTYTDAHIHIRVFPKLGIPTPQIIHFNRVFYIFYCKPSILGYPYSWFNTHIHKELKNNSPISSASSWGELGKLPLGSFVWFFLMLLDHKHMCWGLNPHCFPMVGMVINLIVGVYSHYKDSLLKVGWPSPI